MSELDRSYTPIHRFDTAPTRVVGVNDQGEVALFECDDRGEAHLRRGPINPEMMFQRALSRVRNFHRGYHSNGNDEIDFCLSLIAVHLQAGSSVPPGVREAAVSKPPAAERPAPSPSSPAVPVPAGNKGAAPESFARDGG